jgi:methionyl aminopeptidase
MSVGSQEDLDGITQAGRIAAHTLEALVNAVRPGVTTAELNRVAESVLQQHSARSAPMIVYGFPGSALISVNDEVVHGVPGSRQILEGDLVKLDVTVEKDGYIADTAKTIVVGRGSKEATNLASCAAEAFRAGLSVARPGVRVNEIGRSIEGCVKARGFTVIRSLSGHGVGRTIHEPPTIPNFYARRQKDVLTRDLVITIEPLICAGSQIVFEDADGWTIRTCDGSLAAHHEHTVIYRRIGGCAHLNSRY